MKLRLRSISSRFVFNRSAATLQAPPDFRTAAESPLFTTRSIDIATDTTKHQPLALHWSLFFWLIGVGLATIYFIWFFSNLLQNTLR